MVNFNFLGQYSNSNFSYQLTKKDKKVIRDNDKKYLTPIGNKKISLGNIAIVATAGGAAGYGTGELTNMWRQKRAGLKMTGQGMKAKLIGAGLAGGLGGGLSYYLQTRKTRSDRGRKRN